MLLLTFSKKHDRQSRGVKQPLLFTIIKYNVFQSFKLSLDVECLPFYNRIFLLSPSPSRDLHVVHSAFLGFPRSTRVTLLPIAISLH